MRHQNYVEVELSSCGVAQRQRTGSLFIAIGGGTIRKRVAKILPHPLDSGRRKCLHLQIAILATRRLQAQYAMKWMNYGVTQYTFSELNLYALTCFALVWRRGSHGGCLNRLDLCVSNSGGRQCMGRGGKVLETALTYGGIFENRNGKPTGKRCRHDHR